MSRGRSAAIAVTLMVLVSLLGACSSEDSSAKTAEADRRSATAIKAANQRLRAVVARRMAIKRRKAARRARVKLAKRVFIATPARTTPSADPSAIQNTVASLNAAFRASVNRGITNSTTANHWVGAAVYTGDQCASFEAARGQRIVAETLVIHTGSLVPDPGWVDPVIGRVPPGRIYQMTIDEIQTLVTTGQQRSRTFPIHVTVRANGRARLFLRCH